MKPFNPSEYITVFTDASHCPDTFATGIAYWIKYGDPCKTIRHAQIANECANSTEAELQGLELALARIMDEVPILGKKLVIACDNKSALFAVKIPNEFEFVSVRRKHVKAHQKGQIDNRAHVNVWCDKHAYKHMTQRREILRGTK